VCSHVKTCDGHMDVGNFCFMLLRIAALERAHQRTWGWDGGNGKSFGCETGAEIPLGLRSVGRAV